MADPGHVEILDAFDRLSVRLYRSGLAVAALSLLAGSGLSLAGRPAQLAWWGVTLGTATAVGNMHLYDKRIRWIAGQLAWWGVLLQLLAAVPGVPLAWWLAHGGLGLVFASLSAFAIKEQFCFRIPGLRAVPLFLAVGVFALAWEATVVAGVMLGAAGAVQAMLSVAKSRMPLHFDIGDRSHYQI